MFLWHFYNTRGHQPLKGLYSNPVGLTHQKRAGCQSLYWIIKKIASSVSSSSSEQVSEKNYQTSCQMSAMHSTMTKNGMRINQHSGHINMNSTCALNAILPKTNEPTNGIRGSLLPIPSTFFVLPLPTAPSHLVFCIRDHNLCLHTLKIVWSARITCW